MLVGKSTGPRWPTVERREDEGVEVAGEEGDDRPRFTRLTFLPRTGPREDLSVEIHAGPACGGGTNSCLHLVLELVVVAGGRAFGQKQQQVSGGVTQGRSDHREETHSIRGHVSILGTN